MGIETIAAIGALAGGLGSLKSAFTKPPKAASSNVAAKDLSAQQEDDKRKLARQKQQRKPTETFLTGGQGLATAGETLG